MLKKRGGTPSFLTACLPVHPSIHPVHPSLYLSCPSLPPFTLSIYPLAHPSIYQSIHPVCPSVRPSTHPFIHLTYQSVCPSICLICHLGRGGAFGVPPTSRRESKRTHLLCFTYRVVITAAKTPREQQLCCARGQHPTKLRLSSTTEKPSRCPAKPVVKHTSQCTMRLGRDCLFLNALL